MGFKLKMPKIGGYRVGDASIFGMMGMLGKDKEKNDGAGLTPFQRRSTEEFIKDVPAPKLEGVKIGDASLGAFDRANSAVSNRYAKLREETTQNANAASDKNMDALKRRFSSIGAQGSGAQIKLEQLAQKESEEQKRQAMRDLSLADGEELVNRDLQKASILNQRELAQAGFDQQRNLAQADMDFKAKVFSFERGSKMHELDLAERQQHIDTQTTQFNSRIAEQMARPPKRGLMGAIFDPVFGGG